MSTSSQRQGLLVSISLLMLGFLALQGLGVSEEAVLQLNPNMNPFIAQGSLSALTAGQAQPGPVLAAGAAKLQPPHVTRLPHRYPLGRGGHVEVGLTVSQAPQRSDAQVVLASSLKEWPSCSRRMSPGSPTGVHWAGVAMLRWGSGTWAGFERVPSFAGSSKHLGRSIVEGPNDFERCGALRNKAFERQLLGMYSCACCCQMEGLQACLPLTCRCRLWEAPC